MMLVVLVCRGLNVPFMVMSRPHPTANLVLEDTVERIYHQDLFAEQWVGLFLIRGENVVLLGEIVSITSSPSLDRHHAWRGGANTFSVLIALLCFLGS